MFVPQSNSMPALVETMELLARGAASLSELADSRKTTTRTARYYVDFATWVDWARVDDSTIELTRDGRAFARHADRRARLFEAALARTDLVRAVHKAQREHRRAHGEVLDAREACVRVLADKDLFAASTRARRAGAVANLLEALHHPERFDWSTGERVAADQALEEVVLTFSPRAFLSELGARKFTSGLRHQIGLPRQVLLAARGEHDTLEASRWGAASWPVEGEPPGTRWFGALPITSETRPLIARRNRALRALLITTVPHVAMLVALLTHQDDATSAHITRDMWGTRFAMGSQDLGALDDALRALTRALALDPTDGALWTHRRPEDEPAATHELLALLAELGLTTQGDTSIAATEELHLETDPATQLGHRLAPLRDELPMVISRLKRGAKRRRRR